MEFLVWFEVLFIIPSLPLADDFTPPSSTRRVYTYSIEKKHFEDSRSMYFFGV